MRVVRCPRRLDFDLAGIVDVHGVGVGQRTVVVERVLRDPALERHQRRVENFVNRNLAVGPAGIGLGTGRFPRRQRRRVAAIRVAVVVAVGVAGGGALVVIFGMLVFALPTNKS